MFFVEPEARSERVDTTAMSSQCTVWALAFLVGIFHGFQVNANIVLCWTMIVPISTFPVYHSHSVVSFEANKYHCPKMKCEMMVLCRVQEYQI
jgi:hypothetical protein